MSERAGSAVGVLRRTLAVFVPLALLTGAVLYLFYRAETTAALSLTLAAESRTVELIRQRFTNALEPVMGDLAYLADNEMLDRWLAAEDSAALADLARDYRTFARHKPLYDQIRLIGLDGRELVRLDRSGGTPEIAPARLLENQIDRTYVGRTLALSAGETYVSPLDLNVEHGAVERPPKPVIRFGAPVVDETGRKRGIVLINYLAGQLLDRLAEFDHPGSSLWVLNTDGYWLKGPDVEAEFAFMFPERAERWFGRAFPKAWDRIGAGEARAQFFAASGLFTAARVVVGPDTPTAPRLILVAFVPEATLAFENRRRAETFALSGAFILVLIAIASFVSARQSAARQSAERSIRDSEARFRSLVESAPDAIVISDLDGAIKLVNAATEAMFGYGHDELSRMTVKELSPERRWETIVERRRKLIARARASGRAVDQRETVIRNRAGIEFPAMLRQTVTTVGGKPMIFSVIRDITDLHAQQRALAESEARFRGVIEATPDAIVVSGIDRTILLVNGETEKMLGYTRAELIGADVQMLAPERLRPALHEVRRDIFALAGTGAAIPDRETLCRRSDGSEIDVSARHTVTEMDGRKVMVSALRDISERRAAESKIAELNDRLARDNAALAAVNGELEAFSYSVSHDLRTPLRAIDGFSQALMEDCADKLDEAGRSHLARIRGATQRMALLIDDLLKLARVTRAELNVGDVDLTTLATDVTRELKEREPARAAEIVIAPDIAARADGRLMRIALENLLANAWKFTAERAPARIEFGRNGLNGEAVYYVRDNGAGFDMAYAGKLFGAFQRLHDASKFPGTGVGLATVQRVIRKHGGRIWAEAETGKGATFFFTL